ncbi:hypothetical protein KIW84_015394 [Lathyrus oleraceus]|uniref:Replication factor A C-terminal domain-containing protein n=1 Tax=Pisum sativum TaxID=3888 RepID=A0A9D5H0P0_PEA|nr:hypothetical protein KIW84_015394 [Pisum sativum]
MVKDGQVSNAWSGSKLLINEDIPEIQDFMSKLPTNEQKEKPTQSAKSLSNWPGGSQYSPVERFVHNAKCMSLSQFFKIKHETLCVTVATTLKFAVSKYGWYYYGCTRCSSKAPNPEKAYECSCGQKVEQPIPRYKIEIYVSNGESKYRFVFWDSECAAILGMTAEFMHNSMVENGEDDPMVYPDELEMLLNKKMTFRVKVQPTFSQASVWKLCDDEAFVKEIENDYIVEDNQSKTEYAKLVPNKENLETSAWKVCDHSKKIVFLGGTTMKAIELQNIPPKGYFFKDFGEILQGKCKTDRLEDIIGAVSEINHIQSNTPGKKVVVSVVLKDLKYCALGNCINCNLWEIYGSKFLAYYNDPKNNGAIVILLTHAMVKDGQVSNAWSGSKLLINEDIPEIQDFMSKLPTNEQKEKPTQSAKSLSNWSGGSQYSPVERFVHNAKCMSLSQFCKIKHETLCVTVATTSKFVVSKYRWYYYGCTRCSSKAPNPEKAYECSCGQKVEQPIPRYKIEIYVSNGESKYRFVFWDSECAAIFGMTAEFMHNSMVEVRCYT